MDIELNNIHKAFGKIQANAGIDLQIPAGAIHGILGENGAGKSTLMKILSGFIRKDRGEILIDGRPADIQSPTDAIKSGIGMLHQDPLDFPPMRVIDNFLIGCSGGIFPDRKEEAARLESFSKGFGFSIDPGAYVESLTVGERQQLEIMRLLRLGVQVFILDEPTTGISALQREKLFAALRFLSGEGKTIIFVSHKLEEVEDICSNVSVLREGRLAGEADPPYSSNTLVEMMFGRSIPPAERSFSKKGETVLELKNLAVEDHRLSLSNTNLKVSAGEVLGLAGMEGSGQRAFIKCLAGLVPPADGKIILNGKDMTGRDYHAFFDRGTTLMPAARLEEGLVTGLNLTEHFLLTDRGRGFFINRKTGKEGAKKKIADYCIRGTAEGPVESLSGGNQQRLLLALLKKDASLILLEHPTRGLDIESSIYIWDKLKERCANGAAIIFISADLEEILQYSDRIMVFFSGRASPPLDSSTTTADELGYLIGGKGWQ